MASEKTEDSLLNDENQEMEMLQENTLLVKFKGKIDEATVIAIIEEFHGDLNSAHEVLEQLASVAT